MKQWLILIGAFCAGITLQAQSENSMEKILESILVHNKELKANGQSLHAQMLEVKTANNLSDPMVNYTYLFGSPQELGKSGELTVTQGFDFPTLYGTRNQVSKLKGASFGKQYELFRQTLLLSAKEICLDLVLLNQQKMLWEKRLENARLLSDLYEERLQRGDANLIETNKIRMELMNVQTEVTNNLTAGNTKLQELAALNGGQPVKFDDTQYAPLEFLPEFGLLKQEFLSTDVNLQSLEKQTLAARKQIAVDKGGWLPKFEVGYRRNTGEGEQFNGFIVGGSLPLFENRHKVKIAKAQSLAAELQQANAVEQAQATLLALYSEAVQLQSALRNYDLELMDQSLELLKKALEARQISMIEYFTEVDSICQNKMQYMQLENRYQKIMAQLYKNRL